MIFRPGWVFTSDNSAPAAPSQVPASSRYRCNYRVMDVNFPGFGVLRACLIPLLGAAYVSLWG